MKFISKYAACLITAALPFVMLSPGAIAEQTEEAYTTAYRYDLSGRITGEIKPDPDSSGPLKYPATRNTYEGGRLSRVETGELSKWLSDDADPATDWEGYFTVISSIAYEYDDYGRKVKEIIKDSAATIQSVTQFSYNPKGLVHCKAIRMNKAVFESLPANACAQSAEGADGPDRISRFTYDELDQVTIEERAVGTRLEQQYVTNTYDGLLLKSQTDANGNKTSLDYDSWGRLEYKYYPSPTTPGTSSTTDYNYYKYDANNNLTFERKRNRTEIKNEYDKNNRLIVKDYVNNSQMADIFYDYDLRGVQLYARFKSVNGDGITNTPDGFGNIVRSDTTLVGTTRSVRFSYDENNNRESITHPDNQSFYYGFDALNRATGVGTNKSSRENLVSVKFQPNGKRQSLVRPNGSTATYNFNNGIQLSSLTQTFVSNTFGSGSHNTTTRFEYNHAGQIKLLGQSNKIYSYTGNEDRTGEYKPDGLNRYTKIGDANLEYDDNSNLTNDGLTLYTYDDENRLLTAGNAEFLYDPNGRLFQYVINGEVRQFVYAGDALIGDYLNGRLENRFVHGDQVDEPWVRFIGSKITDDVKYYLHSNHQGSIIAESRQTGSGTGAVTNTLTYDAFGIAGQNNVGVFGYTGQMYLKELGLYYYKARIYSPKLGRFLQTDPIGYKDDMNLYAYTGNDPLNKRDPTGKYGELIIEAVSIGVGVNSFNNNIAEGNLSGAIVDAAGVVADMTLAAVPIAPGVAGISIQASRTGERVLSNSDNVVRGGTNTAERFTNGSGVNTKADGTLDGVSVNSAPGASVEQLSQGIPNGQVGTTTVGEIRAAGGDVKPSPTSNNPNHCTMCGITAQKAEELFNPTIKNPNK